MRESENVLCVCVCVCVRWSLFKGIKKSPPWTQKWNVGVSVGSLWNRQQPASATTNTARAKGKHEKVVCMQTDTLEREALVQ